MPDKEKKMPVFRNMRKKGMEKAFIVPF